MSWRRLLRIIPPLVEMLTDLHVSFGNPGNPGIPRGRSESLSIPAMPFRHSSVDEGYCLECLHKHINTANVLIREALQRFDAKEPHERIVEKVRAAVAELTGAEDDSKFATGRVAEINKKIRDLRRHIWEKGYEFEVPSREALLEIGDRVQDILKDIYNVAAERRKEVIKFIKGVEEKARKLREELEKK